MTYINVRDARNHGDSAQLNPQFRPDTLDDWRPPARDLLAVLHTLRIHPKESQSPLLGVGHSFGGNLTLAAEIIEPGTWTRIVAIEPIVFPRDENAGKYDNPLTAGALKRKFVFDGRDAAFSAWRSRPGFFQRWHPESLRGYVDDGIMGIDAQGSMIPEEQIQSGTVKVAKWTLKTPREQEGAVFKGTGYWNSSGWVYASLGKIKAPTHVVSGTESNKTLHQVATPLGADPTVKLPEDVAISKSVINGTHESVVADHMVPQEKPAEV
ncbi:hypothetical protein HDU93_004806, partial [Gonapodya sp. JEL0774]